jgi:hypothetical protein
MINHLGDIDADRSAGRAPTGRRNWRGRYGREDRHRRDCRGFQIQIWSSAQRPCGCEDSRGEHVPEAPAGNLAESRLRSLGPEMTDQPSPPKPPPRPAPMTPAQLQRMQQQQMVQAALRGGAPVIYANGFAFAQTAADLSIVLFLNGSPTSTLNLSYAAAKSMISQLQRAVKNFEDASGQTLKTLEEITPELNKKLKEPNAPTT